MLKKNKSIKKMKLRSGNKSRKVKKGGTTPRNSVRAFSKKPYNDNMLHSISEESSDMSDMSDVSSDSHSSVRRNPVASNVEKYSAKKRHNMSVRKSAITLSKPVVVKSAVKSKKSEYDIWLEMADKQYQNIEDYTKNYRNIIKNNKKLSEIEQEWYDNNLEFIVDFMGNISFWNYLGFKTIGEEGIKKSHKAIMKDIINGKIKNDIPIGIFSGQHWVSVKKNEKIEFDPYNEYQIFSSNQFCQTFAMMNVFDKLPEKNTDKEKCFTKFYKYTEDALKFIEELLEEHLDKFYKYMIDKKIKEEIIDTFDIEKQKQKIIIEQNQERDDIKEALIECLKHKNICLNCIEYDFSTTEARKSAC